MNIRCTGWSSWQYLEYGRGQEVRIGGVHVAIQTGLLEGCLLVCYYSTLTLLSNLDEKIKCRVRCQNQINPNLLDEMKQAQMSSVLCALK